MSTRDVVVALDCGTSSTKAIAVDSNGALIARASAPLALQTPQPGWVEHRAEDVVASVDRAIAGITQQVDPITIAAVGLSNQRESLVMWNRSTGEAISPVVSWQDRRATGVAQQLAAAGQADRVRAVSGLPLDPMFSAVKATWMFDHFDADRSEDLALGTVDSWLVHALCSEHITEPGNASRTSLLDIATGQWSPELLDIFDIPHSALAEIGASARDDLMITHGPLAGIPLSGLAGDSHAALFAHRGWAPGTAKVTLGTGASVMVAVDADVDSPDVCRTIGWQLPGEEPTRALEANILSAGATVAWLANTLALSPSELAAEARDETDVVIVPAFDGLGAPWWDPEASAVIENLSLSTTRGDLARAALDSVAQQIADVTDAFSAAGVDVTNLIADGSMVENHSLVESIAVASGLVLDVSRSPEASALGAADLAGLGIGMWSKADLEARDRGYRRVEVSALPDEGLLKRAQWRASVAQARRRSRRGNTA